MLLRAQLAHDLLGQHVLLAAENAEHAPADARCPLRSKRLCASSQCACQVADTLARRIAPSWCSDLIFICDVYNSWRRVDLIRRAGDHVPLRGFRVSVYLCLGDSSGDLQGAIVVAVCETAGYRYVSTCEVTWALLKRAISDLLFFTREVVHSDGALELLRHEQA